MILRTSKMIPVLILLVLFVGLGCLYSSCHRNGVFVKQDVFFKQLLWAVIGFAGMLGMSRLDYRRLRWVVIPLYVFAIGSLFIVLVTGRAIMGAQRWIAIGSFQFQPSELGKFALILTLAAYYSHKGRADISPNASSFGWTKGLFLPLGLTLLPTGLVMMQPDLGSALVYIFIYLSMSFLACVRMRYLVTTVLLGIAGMPLFWHVLRDYQKSRLLVFLNPNIDPLGAGYTVIQSRIAIGSGRLLGKGWLSGTQSQLNFLAERHTDFIFSVFGEEWGFVGSFILLGMFAVLIALILDIAGISRELFGKLLASGIAAFLFFHIVINIAMNAGLCPVVGIPLPLMSYGGSALLINLLSIGIVMNVGRQR